MNYILMGESQGCEDFVPFYIATFSNKELLDKVIAEFSEKISDIKDIYQNLKNLKEERFSQTSQKTHDYMSVNFGHIREEMKVLYNEINSNKHKGKNPLHANIEKLQALWVNESNSFTNPLREEDEDYLMLFKIREFQIIDNVVLKDILVNLDDVEFLDFVEEKTY